MANVTVGINSKFNPKGVKDSEKSLDGLKKSLTSVASMAKNMFNFDVLNKAKASLDALTKGSLDVYKANQKAEAALTAATQKNAKMGDGALKNIIDVTNKLSEATESMFDGSELQGQAAFLANLSLTEDQINNVLTAAVELSSAGMGSLESSVQSLAETYGGMAGNLSKSIPDLRTLTKEQLQAGAAIDIVNKKYAGFAATLAQNTMEGKENRFSSAISSMQNGIGQAFAMVKSTALDAINPILERIAAWVNENAPKIGAAIVSYIKVADDIIKNVITNFDTLKKPDTWNEFFSHANNLAASFITYLFNSLKDAFTNAVEILKWVLGNIDIIKMIFEPLAENLKKLPGVLGENAYNIVSGWIDKAQQKTKNSAGTQGQAPNIGVSAATKDAQAAFFSELNATFQSLGDTLAGTDIVALQKRYYREALDEFDLANSISLDSYDVLDNILAEEEKGNKGGKKEKEKEYIDPVEAAIKNGTQIDNLFDLTKSFMDGESTFTPPKFSKEGDFEEGSLVMPEDLLQDFANYIGQIVSAFAQIENVGKVLNPFTTILERVVAVVEPLVNELFAPFVIILESIGDIIGSILAPVLELLIAIIHPVINIVVTLFNILKPFITVIMLLVNIFLTFNPILIIFSVLMELISGIFVFIYNEVLRPIANGIINMFNGVQFAFVFFYNAISDFLYDLTSGIINMGKKKFNAMDQLERLSTATGQVDYKQQEEDSSKYSGSSSVSAPKEIIVNIYFNNSYVNGDAREIALMLKHEMEAASALGY